MWSCWIAGMEFCYLLWGMVKVFQVFPSVPFYSIALPLDQILKFPSEHPTVQDFLHNVFLFSIDEFRRWRWVPTSSDDRILWGEG